ncbi:MAG TPA: Plug domain-containing protein [Leptolyngbyaceae cyanobacterium]
MTRLFPAFCLLAIVMLFKVEPVQASANNSCITGFFDKQPRSVTIVTRSQIEQQAVLSRDLNQILNRLVPSYGFSSRLRASRPTVLIDGAPVARLRGINPSIIERVEVLPHRSDRCPIK